jgi:hypothetical protein
MKHFDTLTSRAASARFFFGNLRPLGLLALLLAGPLAQAQTLTVTGVAPTANQRNALCAANVAVTFSQPLQNTAAVQDAVKVYSQQRGGRMSGSARGTATVSGSTLTFNPTTDFLPGETVLVTTTRAATATGGATLARGRVHQFTTATSRAGGGVFLGNGNLPVGDGASDVKVGDVDGDGDLDLLTTNYFGDTVSVLLNDGSGNYSNGTDVLLGGYLQSLVLGDVDGDGDLDLLTANTYDYGYINVRLNGGDATGTNTGEFSGGYDLTVGHLPTSLALGDVDGDGDLDLVTGNYYGGTVSVRLNGGDATGSNTGVFSAGSDAAAGAYPTSVVVGDVDGDNDVDVLVGNNSFGTVQVLLNNGSGSYVSGTTAAVGNYPLNAALGDVDGDGDLDLFTVNYNPGTVSVRLNGGNATGSNTGVFSAGSDLAVGDCSGLAVGDVDGDGDLDLVTGGFGFLASVLLNGGDATGTNTGAFTIGSTAATGDAPSAVTLGDVDSDGDLDLLTANYNDATASVLLNQPPPTITSFTPTSGPVGTTLDLTGTNLTGATAITFAGTSGNVVTTGFTVASPTSITGIVVPPGAATGPLTVTTPLGTSVPSSQPFTVTVQLTLTTVAPTPGGLGQSITLTGTGLSSPTALTINGANALGTILSNSGTSLLVRVPVTAASAGVVSITTATGTATQPFTLLPPPGNALAFDGVDDYLALPATTPVPVGNAAYTVEAWVNPNTMNLGSILGWGNYGAINQANGLSLNTTGLINYWWGNDLQAPTASLVGRWHHVAATYDGTTRTLYLDGVALGADVPGVHTVPDARNLRIGSNSNGNFTFLNGRLDEVRVYSVALTSAQLRADMTSPTASVPASLVLYYNFDQGTPATASTGDNGPYTTLYDLSPNATPATLTNFALASGNTTSNYVQSYALVVPTATAATSQTSTSFIATWTAPAVGTVTSYLLDVSTTPDFAAPVTSSPFTAPASATSYGVTGLTQNTTYYYRVHALNSALTPADQGAFSNTSIVATPLPVALVSFTATAEGRAAVRLAWATASEVNSARFEVERSLDGTSFQRVSAVAAAGTTTSAHSYALRDATLPMGVSQLYYRLRQVDQDGAAHYSVVRPVTLAGAQAGLSLYPNPVHGGVATLLGAVPGTQATVLDAVGRAVFSVSVDATGMATLGLPPGLAAGVYVVRAGAQALRLTVE